MGICHSGATSETKRSQKLDLRLAVDRDDASKMIKLLLLGPAESGKSTIFKQFRINYGKAHTDAEKKLFLAHMQRNTIQAMKILLSRPEADLRPTLLVSPTFAGICSTEGIKNGYGSLSVIGGTTAVNLPFTLNTFLFFYDFHLL